MDDTAETAAERQRDQVYAAIAEATGKIKRVAHDQTNKHHGFAYASIDQMMAAASDAMSECGLSVEMDLVEATADKNLITIFNCRMVHSSGQATRWVRRDVAVAHHPPHCYGSAESYIFKRYVRFVFCIPTGEDDDPDRQEKIKDPDRRTSRRSAPTKEPAQEKEQKATRAEIDEAKDIFTHCESVEEMEDAARNMKIHVKTNPEVVAHAKETKRVLEDDIPPQYDGREPRSEGDADAETQQQGGEADEEAPPPDENAAQEAEAEKPAAAKPPSKTKLNALVKQIGACNTESELESVCQDLPSQWLEIPEMDAAIDACHKRIAEAAGAQEAADGGEGEGTEPGPEDESQDPMDGVEEFG